MRLKERRIEIRKAFEEFLANPKYEFYCEAFERFNLGVYDRIIITGSVLTRIQLYLWAKRTMALSPPKNPKPRVKELYDRYLNDIQAKLTEDGKIDPDHPGNNSLKQWGKARVGDKLVKLLFKELIGAYRRHREK